MAESDDLLNYDEAAKLLHVSRSALLRWTRPGKDGTSPRLQAYKISSHVVRIRRGDLLALLDPARRPGQATPYDLAAARVDASAALRPYRDFIMADWPEGDDHWRWVMTATERELIDWAEAGKP